MNNYTQHGSTVLSHACVASKGKSPELCYIFHIRCGEHPLNFSLMRMIECEASESAWA